MQIPHTYYKVATVNVFQLPRHNFYYGSITSLVLNGSDKGTVKTEMLVTHVTRPSVTLGRNFMEPANSYNVIHGHYFLTMKSAYPNSAPQFQN